jgi:PAS domain S-box-containing protein
MDINTNLQEELFRQKQDFKALADDSPDIIARFDRQLSYVYVNPAISKVTGIPPSSCIGKTNKDLSIPENQSEYTQALNKVFETGKELRVEFSLRSSDHQLRYFQARLVPETAQNGAVQYVLSVAHDITELLQRTQDLEREKVRDEAILSSMGDGLLVTDASGKVTLMNAVAQALLGFSDKDLVNKALIEAVPMEDESEHLLPPESRPLTRALKTNQKISATYYYRKPDKTRFPVALTVTPLVIGGHVVGAVEVFRDITRERELDHAKDEFISLISHELRTPLTAVKGLASMALSGDYGELPVKLRQPLTNVYVSAERQIHVINDLLNISRLQAGRVKYTLLNFSLKKATEESVRALQLAATQKKITLTVAQATEETFVQGDDIWVKEILHNIIVNAIKFTSTGGVTVSYRMDGELATVVITDTGTGINPTDKEKLFGKFEQLTTPEMGRAIGSGLGLYIARELARKMGGDVVLEKSAPGQGSTFALTLPKADSQKAKEVKIQLEKEIQLALNRREEK